MPKDKLMLRPDEVAELLGLSRAMVYRLLRQGELPCVRLGRAVRVPVDRLHEWVKSQAEREPVTPGPEGRRVAP